MVFNAGISLEALNNIRKNTLVEHLGIEFTAIKEDTISARMPVDARTHQPFGILHGGASLVLAETLGSIAAHNCLDPQKQYAVGLDINANHLRSVKSGWVHGTASPIHIGRSTQVWEIRIVDDKEVLICISRITLAILDRK